MIIVSACAVAVRPARVAPAALPHGYRQALDGSTSTNLSKKSTAMNWGAPQCSHPSTLVGSCEADESHGPFNSK